MLLVCYEYEVAYVRRLYALFGKYLENLVEKEGYDCILLCCFEPPYIKFYLMRDAVAWWRELDFETRQRIKVIVRGLPAGLSLNCLLFRFLSMTCITKPSETCGASLKMLVFMNIQS